MTNPKGELQELCQKKGLCLPSYSSTGEEDIHGLSHSPVFNRVVTINWDGRELSASGVGRSKKEAEKMAASEMLQQIRTLNREDESSEDPFSQPVTSPSRFKGELQELLQKSIPSSTPPKYELMSFKGPAHKREFTVKCVVTLWQQNQLDRTGVGQTIKAAESAAAKNMLCLLQSRDLPEESPCSQVPSSPLSDISHLLSELSGFKLDTEEVESDSGVYLCLAWVSGEQLDMPIAAHGNSQESKEQARTKALTNLVASVRCLVYTC